MIGGYSLLDFENKNISSEPVLIEGLYQKFLTSNKKTFLLCNIVLDGDQYNNVFSSPYYDSGTLVFPCYDGYIKVSESDHVSYGITADKYLSKEEFLTVVTDNSPYVSQTARDGLVKIPQLIGATVAWNQLVQNGNFADGTNGWNSSSPISVNDKKLTLTGQGGNSTTIRCDDYIDIVNSHKYLIIYTLTPSLDVTKSYARFYRTNSVDISGSETSISANEKKTITALLNANKSDSAYLYFYIDKGTPFNGTAIFENMQCTDLTQMFGTAIANYVYSLEQAQEGSGIAWLKSYGFFTKDYYAYDAGSLQSVCTSGRKITALDGTVRTYPIDNEELRGLFKLDANNKLYADGDIYPSSGNGTRKYGIVDLGSLEWSITASDPNNIFFKVDLTDKKAGNVNLICPIYVSENVGNTSSMHDKSIKGNVNNNRIYVKDSTYSTLADFKNAMSGVYLVYELAEETIFSADPYINPQRSEGTEEFVDGLTRDVMIPVGNESTYYKDELFNILGEYIDSSIDAVINMIPEDQEETTP